MSLVAVSATVVATLAASLLAVVVLLTEPRSGGLSGVLGSSGDAVLGATADRGVRRLTAALAATWIVACLVAALAI